MTKVAIRNGDITSFGGIYHIMDVFSKLGLEKLTESVLGKHGSSGKAFSYEWKAVEIGKCMDLETMNSLR